MAVSEKRVVPEEKLEQAMLAGFPCRAYAWVEITYVQVPAGAKRGERVPGVRTWRGRAVIEDSTFLERWRRDASVLYQGPLEEGDEKRVVRSDVYIYRTQRLKAHPDAEAPADAPAREALYVEFVGAGRPESVSEQPRSEA